MPVSKPKPFKIFGPGPVVKREMEAHGWTQEDLSDILNLSPKSVSQIINNKQSITIETAVLLGKAFDSSPEFWMNLENNYRLRLRESDDGEKETEAKAQIRKFMPLAPMKKKGWVTYDRSAESQEKAFKDFWVKDSIEFSMYEDEAERLYARRSKTDGSATEFNTQTWLRKAQTEASRYKPLAYDKKALEALLDEIPSLTRSNDGIARLINGLTDAGIIFMILSHLEKTYLDGAAFMTGENPVVVYTARYRFRNSFWWTITHEIAHVLLHLDDSDGCFVDNLDDDAGGDDKEAEADDFCRKVFGVENLIKSAGPYSNYFTEARLREIAKNAGLEPSIVLGILQFSGMVSYRSPMNKLKASVLKDIPEEFFRG
jgi:HTH-type transcriptional regulator/antitoxin HigA